MEARLERTPVVLAQAAAAAEHHVAVVHGPRGVRLVVVAESLAARERALVGYVRRQASCQLAPPTRDRVLGLLDGGSAQAAVAAYFDAVGREWEDEWLHLEVVVGRSEGTAVA